MSGLGQKRAAEDRVDREGKPDTVESANNTTATSEGASKPEVMLVKRGPRAEDAPTNNPFKGLATTGATGASTTPGFGGFGATGSTGFSGFSFGAKPAEGASTAAAAPAASKFSFSFGAAPSTASTSESTSTTAAAPAAPKFSFNFGSSSSSTPAAAPAASTTTTATSSSAPATGTGFGFNFGAKFDFSAGVKSFAAAQIEKKSPAEEKDEDIDLEKEEPVVAAPLKPNALSQAPVKEVAAGDENDTVLLEVPNTKVFLLGFKDVVGEDGKVTPSTTEKEWKERGVGTLKVTSFELNGATHHRLIMHSNATKQLVLNVNIDKWFAVTGTTEKSVAFRTVVMEEGKPKPHMYNLRVIETAVQGLADKLKELTPKKE